MVCTARKKDGSPCGRDKLTRKLPRGVHGDDSPPVIFPRGGAHGTDVFRPTFPDRLNQFVLTAIIYVDTLLRSAHLFGLCKQRRVICTGI